MAMAAMLSMILADDLSPRRRDLAVPGHIFEEHASRRFVGELGHTLLDRGVRHLEDGCGAWIMCGREYLVAGQRDAQRLIHAIECAAVIQVNNCQLMNITFYIGYFQSIAARG